MRLYLDCEWNGPDGQLLSLALVSDDGEEFYEVLPLCETPHPWVALHVLPALRREPVGAETFRARLKDYLWKYERLDVIADYPEDLTRFLRTLQICPNDMIYK